MAKTCNCTHAGLGLTREWSVVEACTTFTNVGVPPDSLAGFLFFAAEYLP